MLWFLPKWMLGICMFLLTTSVMYSWQLPVCAIWEASSRIAHYLLDSELNAR